MLPARVNQARPGSDWSVIVPVSMIAPVAQQDVLGSTNQLLKRPLSMVVEKHLGEVSQLLRIPPAGLLASLQFASMRTAPIAQSLA